jgi:hypothetical protein
MSHVSSRRGPLGIERLRHIARESDDAFAVDTATQELQRHELLEVEEGGRP